MVRSRALRAIVSALRASLGWPLGLPLVETASLLEDGGSLPCSRCPGFPRFGPCASPDFSLGAKRACEADVQNLLAVARAFHLEDGHPLDARVKQLWFAQLRVNLWLQPGSYGLGEEW
jgi:hypothetical protein